MSGHTPGKWGVQDIGAVNALAVVANPDGYAHEWQILAQVSDDFETQVVANARLMASAPELLAALEGLLNPDGHAFSCLAGVRVSLRCTTECRTAKAAIKAARGVEDS